MKYFCYFVSIIICAELVISELPAYPDISQWKIPMFHKKDKIPFAKIKIIPLIIPAATHTHKETKDFVKTLEYNVQNELRESSNSQVSELDLNHVMDEEFAENIEKDVMEEIKVIDKEFDGKEVTNVKKQLDQQKRPVMLMHQGKYVPNAEYNMLMDGLIIKIKNDIIRRDMDPLHFMVHKRGIVKHLPKNTSLTHDMITKSNRNGNTTKSPLGGGVITGLGKLKRFGNAETRETEKDTLVRSHFTFGPLDIDFVFGYSNGLKAVNSTLSSLSAHALFESKGVNEINLLEFYIDSPMDYEIRMKGSRNERIHGLTEAAITRLCKRTGRMEKRLQRSFIRASAKPLTKIIKNMKKPNEMRSKKLKFNKMNAKIIHQ